MDFGDFTLGCDYNLYSQKENIRFWSDYYRGENIRSSIHQVNGLC